MTDNLRAAAQAALETLEDVFGKDKIDVGAINMLRAALAETTVKESLIAQRPWVGLTGTEINHIFAANVGYPERMMKEVETLLKEKNT